MSEMIQRLRESFSAARSARYEQWYGLTTEPCEIGIRHPDSPGVRILKPAVRFVWRIYHTDKRGELATVEASAVGPVLAQLLDELTRLRSLRPLQAAA